MSDCEMASKCVLRVSLEKIVMGERFFGAIMPVLRISRQSY